MFICGFKKCDNLSRNPLEKVGFLKDSLVHFEEINYIMPQFEDNFHLETSNDENTDCSSSAHDAMLSSDEDNEPTPKVVIL